MLPIVGIYPKAQNILTHTRVNARDYENTI